MAKKRSDYIDIPRETLEALYYEQGLDSNQIAARFGVSPKTILNRMHEYGMERRGHWDYVYLNIPKAELFHLYVEEQLPAPLIAKRYGVTTNVIYRRMAEHGIELRKGGWDKIKRIVPSEKLEWSPDFAYVVGLITADGNLRQGGNEVKLYSTDHELIENYCWALGLRPDDIEPDLWNDPNAMPIHVIQEGRYQRQNARYKFQYGVVFSDYAYRARLEEIGLTPNKSNTLQSLAVPDEYFRDFLRGLFDGDGCWHVARRNKPYILAMIVSGSSTFRDWLLTTIRNSAKIEGGTISGINITWHRGPAERLGEFLYYRPDLLSLTRKRNIWIEWMQNRPQLNLL